MIATEFLNETNIDSYLDYLKTSIIEDPENMTTDTCDEAGIRQRIKDPFYSGTKSILALEDGNVIGRIEYHFYGCLQCGTKMCYVDFVFVSKMHRRKGADRLLFHAMENDCRKNGINQYYLIRSTEQEADRFYKSFKDSSLDDEPLLRKDIL